MNILFILNGISRRKNFFYRSVLPVLSGSFNVEVKETEYAGHAAKLAKEAVGKNYDVVIAAGGDGTIHDVVNGLLMCDRPDLPALGLLPLGSGNDLARTLHLKADAKRLLQLLTTNKPKPVDVGMATLADNNNKFQTHYFINECSLGMGPEVVRRIASSRKLGASITYLLSIIGTFFTHRPQRLIIQSENFQREDWARVLAVSNGRTFGHAIYIAPDAEVNDGNLNIFHAGNLPLWKFLLFLQTLKGPRKIKDSFIHYSTTRSIKITSAGNPQPVEADGELIGFTPLQCEILTGKINFIY